MSQWLENHREATVAVTFTSLVFAVVLGAVLLITRKPAPAPIVIEAITPLSTQTRAPTATPEPIQVYVSGAVAHPGVYVLSWDSRVQQAITAAGGTVTDADLVQVNLAQRLHDEQQIYVPHKGEVVTPLLPMPVPRTASTAMPSTSGQKININTARVSELETLPGIGPALAQRIVDYRQANGFFNGIEDIKEVSGIGDSIFARIKDLITVE